MKYSGSLDPILLQAILKNSWALDRIATKPSNGELFQEKFISKTSKGKFEILVKMICIMQIQQT
jgi:hypothetical protein